MSRAQELKRLVRIAYAELDQAMGGGVILRSMVAIAFVFLLMALACWQWARNYSQEEATEVETVPANPSDPGRLKQDSNHDHQSASAFMATAGVTISFIKFTLVMLFCGLLLPRQGSAFGVQP